MCGCILPCPRPFMPGPPGRRRPGRIDYNAAFDTVDADRLNIQLRRLGACERTRRWFKSYMTGGLQRVQWNAATSAFLPVNVGVRRLGPLVYVIITIDIPDALGNAVSYADDMSTWCCVGSVEDLRQKLESSSAKPVSISNELKLSLIA